MDKLESLIDVLLIGGHLEIVATVDSEGLDRLQRILDKHREVLELIGPPAKAAEVAAPEACGPPQPDVGGITG